MAVVALKLAQRVVAQVDGIGHVLQREGMLLGTLHAKVVDLGPARHDQVVVGDEAVIELNALVLRVDIGNGAHPEADVIVVAEDVAHVVSDVIRLQPGHGHFVEEWLKLVVVVAIHESDLDRRAAQRLRSMQSAKPRAYNDNVRRCAAERGLGQRAVT